MTESATRYPLAWPEGWTRTPAHKRGRPAFSSGGTSITVWKAIERLRAEVTRLGGRDVALSTNLTTRLDGWPYSDQKTPSDPGAAVYFTLKKKDQCLACDTWNTVAGNIAALAAHIDALRRIDRYGVGTLEQAFAGYTALPAAAECEWWLTLQVPRSAPLASIDAAYIELAKKAHPDAGGSVSEMTRLNVARDAARKERK